MKKHRRLNPVLRKIRDSIEPKVRHFAGNDEPLDLHAIAKELSENPICYLTGAVINLEDPSSFQLDHKVPRSRGGDNSQANLALTTKWANQAKSDMLPEEFVTVCRAVLEHHGFEVTSRGSR